MNELLTSRGRGGGGHNFSHSSSLQNLSSDNQVLRTLLEQAIHMISLPPSCPNSPSVHHRRRTSSPHGHVEDLSISPAMRAKSEQHRAASPRPIRNSSQSLLNFSYDDTTSLVFPNFDIPSTPPEIPISKSSLAATSPQVSLLSQQLSSGASSPNSNRPFWTPQIPSGASSPNTSSTPRSSRPSRTAVTTATISALLNAAAAAAVSNSTLAKSAKSPRGDSPSPSRFHTRTNSVTSITSADELEYNEVHVNDIYETEKSALINDFNPMYIDPTHVICAAATVARASAAICMAGGWPATLVNQNPGTATLVNQNPGTAALYAEQHRALTDLRKMLKDVSALLDKSGVLEPEKYDVGTNTEESSFVKPVENQALGKPPICVDVSEKVVGRPVVDDEVQTAVEFAEDACQTNEADENTEKAVVEAESALLMTVEGLSVDADGIPTPVDAIPILVCEESNEGAEEVSCNIVIEDDNLIFNLTIEDDAPEIVFSSGSSTLTPDIEYAPFAGNESAQQEETASEFCVFEETIMEEIYFEAPVKSDEPMETTQVVVTDGKQVDKEEEAGSERKNENTSFSAESSSSEVNGAGNVEPNEMNTTNSSSELVAETDISEPSTPTGFAAIITPASPPRLGMGSAKAVAEAFELRLNLAPSEPPPAPPPATDESSPETYSLPRVRSILRISATAKSPKKTVRFNSEEFEQVVTFDKQHSPQSVGESEIVMFVDSHEEEKNDLPVPQNLVAFRNFAANPQLVLTESKPIRLDSLVVEGRTLVGTICVKNLAFHKKVFVRYTFDKWGSFIDLEAKYKSTIRVASVMGMEPAMDRFMFYLDASPQFEAIMQGPTNSEGTSTVTKMMAFVIRYEVDNHTFWENNNDKNFEVILNRAPIRKSSKTTSPPVSSHSQSYFQDFSATSATRCDSSNVDGSDIAKRSVNLLRRSSFPPSSSLAAPLYDDVLNDNPSSSTAASADPTYKYNGRYDFENNINRPACVPTTESLTRLAEKSRKFAGNSGMSGENGSIYSRYSCRSLYAQDTSDFSYTYHGIDDGFAAPLSPAYTLAATDEGEKILALQRQMEKK